MQKGLFWKIADSYTNKKKTDFRTYGARILTETYGRKDYIQKKNIHNVRQQFQARFGLQPFAGNYFHE